MRPRRWIKWCLLLGCWTALGLIFASQAYVYNSANDNPVAWKKVLAWTLIEWYIWAALSPFILWISRRFRFERGRWATALLVHLPASVGFALLHLLLQSTFHEMTNRPSLKPDVLWPAFTYLLTKKIHLNFLTYWAIVGVSHAALYYRRYHEREARASQLEMQLARSHLQALKMQLHPHFLFNTLHTISELIHYDPAIAERTVARLGDLLRLTLESEDVQEVSLRQELEFLRKYLEIEQTRFHDRLSVDFQIDPQSLDARIPNLILQPLVENAIHHGIAASPTAGRIQIAAQRDDGMLRLQVQDNGGGLPTGWEQHGVKEGIGISNTRERLRQLYGRRHRFELRERPEGGLEVNLEIPYFEE